MRAGSYWRRYSKHICVVGSGPSGFYCSKFLLKSGLDVKITMIEKLPVPYGLVRYGVAPDHPEVKNVIHEFEEIASNRDRFSFFGNVSIGNEIGMHELSNLFDAVVLCYGSGTDKKLGIPGESLPGVISSRDFVNWYNGLPDPKNMENKWFKNKTSEFGEMLTRSKNVVIIGNGNVAMDVARIMVKPITELKTYDLTDESIESLKNCAVENVTIVGRRGPVQASFTTKEFRELTKVDDVHVEIREKDLVLDHHSQSDLESQGRPRKRLLQVLSEVSHVKKNCKKRINFDFFHSPVEILGKDRVESVKFEKTRFEGSKLVMTGKFEEIPCSAVIKCIGYQNAPISGIIIENGVVKNTRGKVTDGVYVSGWLKRGPVGVIATNIIDARETVDEIIQDLTPLPDSKTGDIEPLFKSKHIPYVTFNQFKHIDDHEVKKGKEQGKIRDKVTSQDEMLRIAHQK